ncbi:MAG: hypothetical protein AAF528_04105, partial [Cyanobacteria bacterium P01_C01_bin.121]
MESNRVPVGKGKAEARANVSKGLFEAVRVAGTFSGDGEKGLVMERALMEYLSSRIATALSQIDKKEFVARMLKLSPSKNPLTKA